MYEEEKGQRSVLFRIYKNGNIFSIPVQYVTSIEPFVGKTTTIVHAPDHVVGLYPLHGKNISIIDLGHLLGLEHTSSIKSFVRSLLIIENTKIGFLVETVLGVETLHSRQSSVPLSRQFIQSVYSCDEKDDLILELDIPRLLSIC